MYIRIASSKILPKRIVVFIWNIHRPPLPHVMHLIEIKRGRHHAMLHCPIANFVEVPASVNDITTHKLDRLVFLHPLPYYGANIRHASERLSDAVDTVIQVVRVDTMAIHRRQIVRSVVVAGIQRLSNHILILRYKTARTNEMMIITPTKQCN